MAKGEYLGQEEFQIVVGPARVAYLIRMNSEAGYRRAVQEASTRWGGFSEPIVPVRASGKIDGFWRQVVELANVDEVVNVDAPATAAYAAAKSLGLDLVPLQAIDRSGPGQFTCHPGVTSSQSTMTHVSLKDEPDLVTVRTVWNYAGSRQDMWAITAAGSLTPEAAQAARDLSEPIDELDDSFQIAIAQVAGRTLLDRTGVQLRERWASGGPFPTPAIIWFCNRSALQECLLYWNRRALRPLGFEWIPMMILPAYQVEKWPQFHYQIQPWLNGRPNEFAPDTFLCSHRVPHEKLRTIGNSWRLVEKPRKRPAHRSSSPRPRHECHHSPIV